IQMSKCITFIMSDPEGASEGMWHFIGYKPLG
ncbi:unnamed protein product, partial [marine sediment metagenome]